MVKKIIAVVICIALMAVFVGCGSKDSEVPGTWELKEGDSTVCKMVLYEGGTGDGYEEDFQDGEKYALTWEVKDDIVNVSLDNSGMFITGYEIEEDIMVSVDGNDTFVRVK